MGAETSKITNMTDQDPEIILHEIATKYILSQNSKDLFKLANPEKCKKLVILTSNTINKYFTPKYISYLDSKLKRLKDEKLLFFNKDDTVLNKFDSKGENKNRKCIGIAKFYVKIAHLFSAISLTINPVYKWKKIDETGNIVKKDDGEYFEQTASLLKIENHPDYPDLINNPDVKISFSDSFCTKRHSRLVKIKKKLVKNNLKFIDLSPMCHTREKDIDTDGIKTLANETGFSSLEKLYFDKYDYEKGAFYKEKDTPGYKRYLEHLKILYNTFKKDTDPKYEDWNANKDKKFTDVIIQYQYNSDNCIGEESKYQNKYTLSNNDLLFANYITFLKEMIDRSNKSRKEIVSILLKVFKLSVNKQTEESEVIIDPELTSKKLDDIICDARKQIFNLYITCENDYNECLKRFEAIIQEGKVLQALEKSKTLEKESLKLHTNMDELPQALKDKAMNDLQNTMPLPLFDNSEKNPNENSNENLNENVQDNPNENVQDNPNENVQDNPNENVQDNPNENVQDNPNENVQDNPNDNIQDNQDVKLENTDLNKDVEYYKKKLEEAELKIKELQDTKIVI